MRYTIKQMAEMFGVTEHTLRFYTDKRLLPCERDRRIRELDAGHPMSERVRGVP